MPKKTIVNPRGPEAARSYIQRLRDESGGMKPFYKCVHGRDPEGKTALVRVCDARGVLWDK